MRILRQNHKAILAKLSEDPPGPRRERSVEISAPRENIIPNQELSSLMTDDDSIDENNPGTSR